MDQLTRADATSFTVTHSVILS